MLSSWIRQVVLSKPLERSSSLLPRRPAPVWLRPVFAFFQRWPFVTFFLLIGLSNLSGSCFSFAYNGWLILPHYLDDAQRQAFPSVALCYNLLAYGFAVGAMLYLAIPLSRCRRQLLAGEAVPPDELTRCRRRLIKLPGYQVWLNLIGWLPGAVFFPLGICLVGGWYNAEKIWWQFAVSFLVSALVTTVQTFFLLEAFLVRAVYPDFFHDARPADVPGARYIPLTWRLGLYFVAMALAPMISLLVVALNFTGDLPHSDEDLPVLAVGVFVFMAASSGFTAWMISLNVISWIRALLEAIEAIRRDHFEYRIREIRPDEFGQGTDGFNDMAQGLEVREQIRKRFGHVVGPQVRDALVKNPGLGGEKREVTVLFVDIRGFTRRSAGPEPEKTVALLNRFMTLAVAAIQEQDGVVNKFLGDGLMALFNAPEDVPDHADRAVLSAQRLLRSLDSLNQKLLNEGQAPLEVGIGIHTGPAVVGSIGADFGDGDGQSEMRCEYTAIGETINLGSRLEQMTKKHGGPVLLSAATQQQLKQAPRLVYLGPQPVYGFEGELVVYRLEWP